MGIGIITGFESNSPEMLDLRSGPYYSTDLTDTTAITDALDPANRFVGQLCFLIDTPKDPITDVFGDGNISIFIFDVGTADHQLIPFGEYLSGSGGAGWDGTYNLQVDEGIYLYTTNNQRYLDYVYIDDAGGPWDGRAEVRLGNDSDMHVSILGIIQKPLKLKNSNSLQAYDSTYSAAHNLIYLSSADLIKIGNYVHQTSILSLDPSFDPVVRQGDSTTYTDYTIWHEGNLTPYLSLTKTYIEMTELVNNNQLVPGYKYILEPYISTYIIHNSDGTYIADGYGKPIMQPGGVVNTEVHDGTNYGAMVSSENPAPTPEKLLLTAASPNSFVTRADSLTFPGDTVDYDFNDTYVNATTERPGWISARYNAGNNLSISEDYRHFRGNRRWKANIYSNELIGPYPYNFSPDLSVTPPDYEYVAVRPTFSAGKKLSLFNTGNVVSGSLRTGDIINRDEIISSSNRAPLDAIAIEDFKDFGILNGGDGVRDIHIQSLGGSNNILHSNRFMLGVDIVSNNFRDNTFRGEFDGKFYIRGFSVYDNCFISGRFNYISILGSFVSNLSFMYAGNITVGHNALISSSILYTNHDGDISVPNNILKASAVLPNTQQDSAIVINNLAVDSIFEGISVSSGLPSDRRTAVFNGAVQSSYFVGKTDIDHLGGDGYVGTGAFVGTVFHGAVTDSKLHLSAVDTVFNGKLHGVDWEGTLNYATINTSVTDHTHNGLSLVDGNITNSHPWGGLIMSREMIGYEGDIKNNLFFSLRSISSSIDSESYTSPAGRTALLAAGFSYVDVFSDDVVVMYGAENTIVVDALPLGYDQIPGTSFDYDVKYRLPGGNTVFRSININLT